MSTFVRPSAPAIEDRVARVAARAALAAALFVACVAWPSPAAAQERDAAVAASGSASANSPGADNQQSDEDSGLPAATRNSNADVQRLLGGPNSAVDPYESDDPSPNAQEAALMSEQRMTIVSPSDFYSSGSRLGGASADGGDGGSGGSGGSGAIGGSGKTTHFGRQQAAANQPDGNTATPTRYGYSDGGLSSPVYRNPYDTQATTAQPYRAPW